MLPALLFATPVAALASAASPFVPETNAWAAAVVNNGGAVSETYKGHLDTLIRAWKAAGSWALIDDAWLLVAEGEIQALTSLKQLRLATAVNSPSFSADAGYTFDGSTNYIDTGYAPASHAAAADANNQRLSAYERTDAGGNTAACGMNNSSGSNTAMTMQPRTGTGSNMTAFVSSGSVLVAAGADSRGYSSASRAGGGTTVKAWRNGSPLSDQTAGAVNNILANRTMFIGGRNTGSLGLPRASTIGYVDIGAPLTSDAMELAHYNALQAFMTARGAHV